jgi:hypothetical protein|tara:strand:- start:86 stop:391 length:306 start_codon:yes stop_codon:yes gene_type:complete
MPRGRGRRTEEQLAEEEQVVPCHHDKVVSLRVRSGECEASLHREVLTRHLVDGLHRLVLARGGRVQRVEVAPDLRVPRVQEDVNAHAPGAIGIDHVAQDAP